MYQPLLEEHTMVMMNSYIEQLYFSV